MITRQTLTLYDVNTSNLLVFLKRENQRLNPTECLMSNEEVTHHFGNDFDDKTVLAFALELDYLDFRAGI